MIQQRITLRYLNLLMSHTTVGDMFGKDTHWRIMEKGDGFLLQLTFLAPDTNTEGLELQSCRKWYISSHSTTSEVIETAFKAARAAIDHELKENFRFEGELVYNPHFDVLARKELCCDERFDVRG